MKCPLRFAESASQRVLAEHANIQCLQAECGQWDENTELCARVAEVRVLTAIGNVLGRIHIDRRLNRITYRCRDCGMTIEKSPGDPEGMPTGWTRTQLVDGKYIMLCERCKTV